MKNKRLCKGSAFLFVIKILPCAGMNIGQSIRTIREGLGLTQDQVSKGAKLTQGFYSRIENGFDNPSIDALERISEVFGLPLFFIIWNATDTRSLSKNTMNWYNKMNPRMQRIMQQITLTNK